MRWRKAMGAMEPESVISDSEAEMSEGGMRPTLPSNKPTDEVGLISEPCEQALLAGARSMADIDNLLAELLSARDYLHFEAERVRQVNARYAHLAQTASASVKNIAENLGKWRSVENVSPAQAPMPGIQAVHGPE